MVILKNIVTKKELKLSDAVAREVFGIDGPKHEHLLCLPARNIAPMPERSVKIIHENRAKKKKIGGICIVRMGGIGDLVILSSSIVKLKKKYPNERITLATLAKYLFMKDLAGIDLCIDVDDLHKYSFDKVIDLRHAVEPPGIGPGSLLWRKYISVDRSDCFDFLCGVNSSRKYFNVPLDRHVKKFLFSGQKRPFIGFCPTAKSTARVIPPEYVEPTIKMLSKRGTVILFGQTEHWNRGLKGIGGCVNILDATTERELASVCARMDVIISPDTGVLHIAGALKKKAVGLFGPINPQTRISYYKNTVAIFPVGELPCIPCHDVPGACDHDRPGAPCMRLITPGRIDREVRGLLC